MSKNYVEPIILRSIDSSLLNIVLWRAFSAPGLDGACNLIRITNVSKGDVVISYDGVYSHEFIPSDGKIVINLQTNSSPSNYNSKFRKGTKVYVSGNPSVGYIHLAGYFT